MEKVATSKVTPHARVVIETQKGQQKSAEVFVTPHARVGIETAWGLY